MCTPVCIPASSQIFDKHCKFDFVELSEVCERKIPENILFSNINFEGQSFHNNYTSLQYTNIIVHNYHDIFFATTLHFLPPKLISE